MKRALVVHGCEGLDELSIAGPSKAPALCFCAEFRTGQTCARTFSTRTHLMPRWTWLYSMAWVTAT